MTREMIAERRKFESPAELGRVTSRGVHKHAHAQHRGYCPLADNFGYISDPTPQQEVAPQISAEVSTITCGCAIPPYSRAWRRAHTLCHNYSQEKQHEQGAERCPSCPSVRYGIVQELLISLLCAMGGAMRFRCMQHAGLHLGDGKAKGARIRRLDTTCTLYAPQKQPPAPPSIIPSGERLLLRRRG